MSSITREFLRTFNNHGYVAFEHVMVRDINPKAFDMYFIYLYNDSKFMLVRGTAKTPTSHTLPREAVAQFRVTSSHVIGEVGTQRRHEFACSIMKYMAKILNVPYLGNTETKEWDVDFDDYVANKLKIPYVR